MLFVVQTLTLLTALASLIFLDKRLLAVISTIVCPISTALMIYIFMYLSQIPYFGWVNYRVGYWLTYFSEALFVINAMLKIKLDDRKTHHS
jgi:fructose-specific phosphotransferase system IIC component